MNGIKHWKDWLHPVATVMGAWGGFPKPPTLFLELTRFELFRWFLVFVLAYQGGAEEDIRQALIITVIFYLITKLLDLRDITSSDVPYSETAVIRHRKLPVEKQKEAREASAEIQAAQQAAAEAAAQAAAEATAQVTQNQGAAQAAAKDAAAKTEAFFGGYYF